MQFVQIVNNNCNRKKNTASILARRNFLKWYTFNENFNIWSFHLLNLNSLKHNFHGGTRANFELPCNFVKLMQFVDLSLGFILDYIVDIFESISLLNQYLDAEFFFFLWFYLAKCKISGDLFFIRLVELLDLWNVWIRCTLIIKNEICLPDQKLVDCKFQCRRRFIIITQTLLSINITLVVVVVVAVSMPAIACNVTERIWMNFDYLHRM